MKTVFILEAEHFHMPGRILQIHATKESADAAAAGCVNDLRDWVQLPKDATAENWETKLKEARRKRARDMSCKVDELGDDDGHVSVLPEPVIAATSDLVSTLVSALKDAETEIENLLADLVDEEGPDGPDMARETLKTIRAAINAGEA